MAVVHLGAHTQLDCKTLCKPDFKPYDRKAFRQYDSTQFDSNTYISIEERESKRWDTVDCTCIEGETKIHSMKWGKVVGKNSGKVEGGRERESQKCDGKDMGRVEDGEGIKKRGKLDSNGMGKMDSKTKISKEEVDLSMEEVGVNALSMERQKKGSSHKQSLDAVCYETAEMVPHDFVCRLSKRIMEEPVVVASGKTYERANIQAWLDGGNIHCPITQKPLSHLQLTPNLSLKSLISSWMASHSCNLGTTSHHSFSCSTRSFSSCPTPTDAHHHSFSSCSSSSVPKLLRNVHFDDFSSSFINSCSSGIPEHLGGAFNDSFTSTPSTSDCSSFWGQERDAQYHSHDPSLKSVPKGQDKEDPKCKRVQKSNLHPKSDDPILPSVKPSIYVVSRINTLVSSLESEHVEKQRSSAAELRLLAKSDDNNRMMIANAGALRPLVALLQSSDRSTQQDATTTLLNLSINTTIKADVVKAGAIEPLVRVLREGLSSEAKGNAAVALAYLSFSEDNKAKIGSAGAISPLVGLLDSGSTRVKKDAAAALYVLSSIDENKRRIVRAGATRLLVEFMSDDGGTDGMVDKGIAILRNLVSIEAGRVAFVVEKGIMFLLQIIQTVCGKSKELAVSILLQLCSHSTKHRSLVLQMEPLPALVALSESGNSRLKDQVTELIHILMEPKARR